jgi:hypothetical protein
MTWGADYITAEHGHLIFLTQDDEGRDFRLAIPAREIIELRSYENDPPEVRREKSGDDHVELRLASGDALLLKHASLERLLAAIDTISPRRT